MKKSKHAIYGLRLYPDSTERFDGNGGTIFVHGNVSRQVSDFFHIFRCMVPVLEGRFVADSFIKDFSEDPQCELVRKSFGRHLVSIDAEAQVIVLDGDGFMAWGSQRHFVEGAFLPIFNTPPNQGVLRDVFGSSNENIRLGRWPSEMRGLIHMWDDIYWELFSNDPCDINRLMSAHRADKHLKLYAVDIAHDYPEPRNDQLQDAKSIDGSNCVPTLPIFRNQSFELTDSFGDVTGWVGISKGDIYFDERPFGSYYGYWTPNEQLPAFVVVIALDDKLNQIGTIGARVSWTGKRGVELVSDDILPWRAGFFEEYIQPEDIQKHEHAVMAASLVEAIVKNDLGLYKYLTDPSVCISP